MLHNGLYEQIINKGLDSELSTMDKLSQTAPIDSAEASKALAKYVAEIVEKGLDNVKDNGGDLSAQVLLINRIVETIMTGREGLSGFERPKTSKTQSYERVSRKRRREISAAFCVCVNIQYFPARAMDIPP